MAIHMLRATGGSRFQGHFQKACISGAWKPKDDTPTLGGIQTLAHSAIQGLAKMALKPAGCAQHWICWDLSVGYTPVPIIL
jgi:hypothetical protein